MRITIALALLTSACGSATATRSKTPTKADLAALSAELDELRAVVDDQAQEIADLKAGELDQDTLLASMLSELDQVDRDLGAQDEEIMALATTLEAMQISVDSLSGGGGTELTWTTEVHGSGDTTGVSTWGTIVDTSLTLEEARRVVAHCQASPGGSASANELRIIATNGTSKQYSAELSFSTDNSGDIIWAFDLDPGTWTINCDGRLTGYSVGWNTASLATISQPALEE